MRFRGSSSLISVLGSAALSVLGMGGVALATPIVGTGDSLAYYAPHHAPDDLFHEEHYFIESGDIHHFAWFNATPATPGPITIKYDFRAIDSFANLITAGQMARAGDALSAWSGATGGKVVFVQDTLVPDSAIINIGTGNLAALGFTSGPGGILGLGGGVFTHLNPAVHSITGGVAWMDFADTWDETMGNGNPAGTFDYFAVAAQEIGHALGLGHTDNTGSLNIMNGFYSVEQTALSLIDIDHIQSIYGAAPEPVPEPGTLLLVVSGLAGLGAWKMRRQRRQC